MSGRWGLWALVVGLLAGCADREKSSMADGRLTATPAGIDFQRVAVFDGREAAVTIRNVGRSRIEVDDIWVEGPEGQYLASFSHEGPHSLLPGSECGLKVRFAPLETGELPATLVIRSDAKREPILRIPLKGAGVDAWARVSPHKLDFGRIEAESSKTLGVTVENPTDMPVEVATRLVGADKDEFSIAPVTLAAWEKRELPLTFSPVKVGRKSVALAVTPCRGCADVPVLVSAEALDRAVVAEPPELDFGGVPIDKDKRLMARIRNISTEPMTVTQLDFEGRDASFSHAATGFPLVLQPGEVREWELRYSPGHMGFADDTARFHVVSKRNPITPVALLGHGGAAELCVSPVEHNFGAQPLGAKASVIVNVKNCGSENGGPLKLTGLDFQPDPSGPVQFGTAPMLLPYTLNPGQEVNLKVFYEPTREGAASGALVLSTNAFNAATVRLDFQGVAQRHEPCQLAITPMAVNFGTVPPRRGAVLGVKLENRGSDLCPVKNIKLRDDGGGVFRMPGGDLDGVIMYPGNWFSFQVAFDAPASGGTFLGSVQVEQADPANPLVLVPLQAHSQSACLVPTPRFVDFGVGRKDCPPAPRQVNYLNACPGPITVSGVRLGAGTTDSEFFLKDAPNPLPITLQPGDAFTAEVEYYAQVTGMNLSPLFVDSSDLPEPLLVPLLGESSKRVDKKDTFIQQDGSKVDVLFVVDNTASMVEEQPRFISALPSFVSTALEKNVDLHVAVTTTGIAPESNSCPGGAMGGEAGRLFPVDGSRQRILTHQTQDLATKLQGNAQVGLCASVEQGFEAVRRALSEPLVGGADDPRTPQPNDGNAGFLRDEAALVVVFVGDEDDHSPDSVETYVRFFQGKKGEFQPQRMTIYAIAPTQASCSTAGGYGTRYAEAASRTGGEVVSVCDPDYAPLLRNVANKAFSPQDRFPLSELPDPGSVTVRVNGAPVTSGWTYDAGSNSVVFAPSPAPGAKVEIAYRRACQ
ncbi:choice-of-anchor D domain-containing protein [Hyalangium gracile]|uniref:choice-of-anchor D domain-containing protein n=1 Tax=Hyalangium gracile TaxID=394092 RepID=UPI001CC94540|nr:choice-of-anchor D domain-containing protein [Hyalangium gracile]